jgi:hypothetical protein
MTKNEITKFIVDEIGLDIEIEDVDHDLLFLNENLDYSIEKLLDYESGFDSNDEYSAFYLFKIKLENDNYTEIYFLFEVDPGLTIGYPICNIHIYMLDFETLKTFILTKFQRSLLIHGE